MLGGESVRVLGCVDGCVDACVSVSVYQGVLMDVWMRGCVDKCISVLKECVRMRWTSVLGWVGRVS